VQPPMFFPCPRCGAAFQLTPEYLAQYGGQMTRCSHCGQPFALPPAHGAAPPATSGQPPAAGEPGMGQPAPGQPAAGQPATVIPYAAPAYGQAGAMEGAWSEGDLLVVRKGARLPHDCVKCGLPGDGRPVRKTFYWHEPWVYITILGGLLVYVIIALVVRQSGQVEFALCSRHRARRRNGTIGGLLGLFGGIALFVAAGMQNEPYLVPVGIFVLIAGVIVALIMTRVLTPKRIDAHFLWLRGAGPTFLQALPPAR
jgi:predicted Zn finger-like uncharacterized protein